MTFVNHLFLQSVIFFQIKNGTLDGSTINKAISKLTDDFFGDFFNEEGRPNIEVLIAVLNCLICLQIAIIHHLCFSK